MDDYLTKENNEYWYGLITGIFCAAIPEAYTGDQTKDITERTLLYVEKGSEYEADAGAYIKALIRANLEGATDEEVSKLMEEAKSLSASGKTAHNGKGIHVGYYETDDHYEYQVARNYEE